MMKAIIAFATLWIALTAPAFAQASDPLFMQNGVFGALWGTDAEEVEAILLRNTAITKADMRDIGDTDTTDYLFSYNWTNDGFTYALETFVARDTDRFVSVELSHDTVNACTALERFFTARLGDGVFKENQMTDTDGAPYTALTRIWDESVSAGNLYGYVYLPGNGDDDDYCMVKIINMAAR